MGAKGLQILTYSGLAILLLEHPEKLFKIIMWHPSLDKMSQKLWGGSQHLNISKIFRRFQCGAKGNGSPFTARGVLETGEDRQVCTDVTVVKGCINH